MKITWGGHSTTLIQIGDHKILTDPNLATRLFFLKRHSLPGLTDHDISGVTKVVVSHAHLDHMDKATMRRLPKSAEFVVRGKIADIPRSLNFTTHAMELWESQKHDDLTITCLPVKHLSGRWLLDFWKYLPASYMIEHGGKTIYFGGDTAYTDHFKQITERFPKIDIAILPIGAYEPRVLMQPTHVDPYQAVQAFIDLNAEVLIPIHWGTFKLSREPFDAPPKVLMAAAKAAGVADRIRVLLPGENYEDNRLY